MRPRSYLLDPKSRPSLPLRDAVLVQCDLVWFLDRFDVLVVLLGPMHVAADSISLTANN